MKARFVSSSIAAAITTALVLVFGAEVYFLRELSLVAGKCAALMEGTRASGDGASSGASSQPLPDGNHGENVLQGATP